MKEHLWLKMLAYILIIVIVFAGLFAAMASGVMLMLHTGVLGLVSTLDFNPEDFAETLGYYWPPEETHLLLVERINPGATEPYWVRASLVEVDEHRPVYYVRGEKDAEIVWLTEDIVSINGAEIDLTSGACYRDDARNPQQITISVLLNAADVYALSYEYSIGNTPLGGGMITSNPKMTLPLPEGGTVSIDIPKRQLFRHEANGDLCLSFAVTLSDGSEITLPEGWTLPVIYEENHALTLSGSSSEGYEVKANE